MAGHTRTRSFAPITALGAALAVVLVLSGVWTGTAPGASGASDPAGTPFGHVDNAVAVPGGIQLWGWAIDPDTTSPIYVWVTLDGTGRHLYANKARPDVAAAYPGSGPDHGFAATLTTTPGAHRVCVTASNVGPGAHKPLGCRSVSVRAGSPVGNYEKAVGGAGAITVSGWAIDPDTTSPIYVWVTLDGVGRHRYANTPRPDVAAAYPGYGPDHGFTATLSAAAGTHTVCVTASNVGPGAHTTLGCRTVTVIAAGSPFGNFEDAHGVVAGIEVKGWTIDPDTTTPIYVWVTVDGAGRHLYANQARPDVAAAYPGYGPHHGFTATLTTTPGVHTICITASNIGPGTHRSLGCRTVQAGPWHVTETIDVGPRPRPIAADPARGAVYVGSLDDQNVSVIDTATNAVTDTIAVGGLPIGLAVDPSADEVYVTTYVGNMSVIDTTTGEVNDTIDVQGRGVAVDPAAQEVYVSTGETLVVIDTATHLAIATVENVDGGGPVVVDPGTRTIFVADYFGDAVSVIDAVTRQVVDSIPVGSAGPTDIALNPALREVYVTNGDDVTVSVIDVTTLSVIDTIAIPGPAEYAGSVAVDPVAQAIYVGLTAFAGDPESVSWSGVARIDAATREVTDLITVGTDVGSIAVDPTTGTVYVTGGTVSVLQAD